MKDVIIVGTENITKEGMTLKLNKPARLHERGMATDEWWVSWDKIRQSLLGKQYTKKVEVQDRQALRDQQS